MKKISMLIISGLLFIGLAAGCGTSDKALQGNSPVKETGTVVQVKADKYKDGIYNVQTQPDVEGYYSKAQVTVKDEKIAEIDWKILDWENREFDEGYGEKAFPGNELYQNQCINDLKGAKTYGPKLVETQEVSKVDAVTGATWANKKFKEVINLALENAKE